MHPAWRSRAEEPNNSIYSATLLAFTSDFLSFIVVEHIWFFHRVLQLFRGGLLVNICTVRLFVSWCAILLAWQCAKCENEAKLYCCWSTSYCSVLCQKEHWEHEHSSQCRHKQQTVLPTLSAQNCCWLRLSLSLSLSLSSSVSLSPLPASLSVFFFLVFSFSVCFSMITVSYTMFPKDLHRNASGRSSLHAGCISCPQVNDESTDCCWLMNILYFYTFLLIDCDCDDWFICQRTSRHYVVTFIVNVKHKFV